jgi:myo-inositol-1(or 4)-monophosphatase
MLTLELEFLCEKVCAICKATAEFIHSESGKVSPDQVELKGVNDFVTAIDKASEKLIVDELQQLIPGCGFITEENTRSIKDREYEWIIDPLDGTTNFIHGVPLYCVSVGLRHKEEIVLGVIYEANLKECFFTWKGAPSYLNGKVIQVSRQGEFKESLIATGFPNRDYSRMKPYMALMNDLMFSCHGLRRLGSAAADLAYVACGRFEAFYEYYLAPWDVAAGVILVKNAGGRVTDFSGGDNYLFGQEIIASNDLIHDSLLERLQRHFDEETN